MKEKWNETSNRYIAFIDIMGFSNLVYRNTHDSVKKKMLLFTKAIAKIEKVMKEGYKEDPKDFSNIRTVVFSDSVLILTPDSSKISLRTLLFACEILLAKSLESEISIKGAISYGQITADFEKSIFFGKGLIDAYKLEQQILYFGIAVDHKIEKKIRTLKLDTDNLLIRKKIPTKSGKINHYIIDWKKMAEGLFKNKSQTEILMKLYENMSGHPRIY